MARAITMAREKIIRMMPNQDTYLKRRWHNPMEKNTSETPRNDREMEAYNPLRTHAVAFTGSMLLLLI